MKKILFLFFTIIQVLIISCKSPVKNKGSRWEGRFFSDSSFWNQPIPLNAEIDPRNDKWIAMLKTEPTGENFGTSYSKWTIPVYEVDSTTPVYEMKKHYLSEEEKQTWHTDKDCFGHGPGYRFVPIPDGAMPDSMEDAHYVAVDRVRKLVWDMWGMRKLPDGSIESNTGMFYRLDGSGVFDTRELGVINGESVHFHGPGRAAGVPVMAGLIMYDEVLSGEIRHKLSCATRFNALQEFVFPASWTDGYVKGGIPEGAVIQLDPELNLEPYALTPEEKIVARALQKYGMVVVDNAAGQPIYAEGLWGHPGKTWVGKLREWDGGINSIPYDHFRVLKIENAVNMGDARSIYHPVF